MPPEWYALENIEDSIDDVKEFLLPFDKVLWAKIIIILIFVGLQTSGSTPYTSIDLFGLESDFDTTEDEAEDLIQDIPLSTIAIVGLAIVALITLFKYLSNVFEFILYQTIADKRASILKDFKTHWINGIQYFLFRAIVWIIGISSLLALIAAYIANIWLGMLLTPLSVLFWIILGLVLFYTHNLALPEMIMNNSKFTKALTTSLEYIKSEWKQAGVFVIVKIGLSILVSILWSITIIILAGILIIPLLIIGMLSYMLHIYLIIPVIIIGLILFVALSMLIQVPLQTFIYQYALNVYQDFAAQE